jgi:flagellin
LIQKSIERLSSGLRINRAGDDAAGLTVANRLRTQVQGLNQAIDNASSGINLINVAEGALEETTIRLNRIRQLAIQSANTGVNDFKARSAIQDEVFQSIDEITRIANTTQFSSNFLIKGDFSINTTTIDGQEEIGLTIDASPVASTLGSGKSFLNIIKSKEGTTQIVSGDALGAQQTLNTGIINQTDVAISIAKFDVTYGLNDTTGVSVGTAADFSAPLFFNGVSVSGSTNFDVFTFSGVLSDGVTEYNGSFSIGDGTNNTIQGFVSTINGAIQNAEKALFGVSNANSVPTAFRTTVTLTSEGANAGRLSLISGTAGLGANLINQSSIDISLVRGGNIVTSSNGVTRSGEIGADSILGGQGQIGNSVTAITGSTFGSGQFEISVEDVQSAQQRKLESTIAFRDQNGSVVDRAVSLDGTTGSRSLVLNGSFVNGTYTGGTSLRDGDTITLTGTNVDGSTFQSSFTFDNRSIGGDIDLETSLNDFKFSSISGLVQELNFRTRDYTVGGGSDITDGNQTRFEDATFTFTPAGTLQLVDDIGRSNSQTSFTLTFEGKAGGNRAANFTLQDDADLTQEGFYEEATFRVDGGEAVRAKAGDVVTLQSAESTIEGVPQPQVTFRIGNGFTAGIDKLEATPDEFVGRLNGGASTTFTNGDQDVVFIDGNSGGSRGVARFVTVDFDNIVDVTQRTDGLADAGRTVVLSTINRSFNFHIGSGAYQSFTASIGDLTSNNLGFGTGSGRTVSDIDVTSLTGANEAILIVDEALDQVNKTRSILGAATNRLEASISNLSVSAENLTASESRIRDADIARESSTFTKNQVLSQAGLSVLAQANFQSQGFLSLLG